MFKREAVLALVVVVLGFMGCRSRENQIAELREVHGMAERDFAAKRDQWTVAPIGVHFAPGDAVRTGTSSDAYVGLTRGGGLKLGPGSLVRFGAASTRAQPVLGVEAGEAEIESGPDSLAFDTTLGLARIEPGGRLRVTAAADQATQFEVLVGRTVLENDGAPPVSLGVGEKIFVDIGGAIVERDAAPPAAARPVDAGAPANPEPADASAPSQTITVSVEGKGAQVRPLGKPWGPLGSGDTDLSEGTRVRLPKATSMSVRRGGERVSVRGQAETIIGGPEGSLVTTLEGQAALDAAGASVRIDVPGGSIIARAGSQADVSVRRGGGTDVSSERGEVEIRGRNDRTVLATGQSTTLGRDGTLDVVETPLTRADLSITAGESAVVHDPAAPTAVRVQFQGVCKGRGEVDVTGSSGRSKKGSARFRGSGSAVVLAGAGANRYRVRCIDESGTTEDSPAKGLIRVTKDSGAARVPRVAPHNSIDADGRHYTVLYQNLLPELTFNWPSATPASSYMLRIEQEHGTPRNVSAASASVKFASGEFGEGKYRFWFEIPGDSAHRSPQTALRIDFDNAAPAAQIQEPADGAPIAGTVTVAGVATEGASVTVGGTEIPLDAQFRFRGDAAANPGDTSLAIRITHPKHGVHYYLRKLPKGEP